MSPGFQVISVFTSDFYHAMKYVMYGSTTSSTKSRMIYFYARVVRNPGIKNPTHGDKIDGGFRLFDGVSNQLYS